MLSPLLVSLLLASAPASAKKAPKKLRFDAVKVEGRIQKPQAFYILPRSTLTLDELQKTESFVKKVEQAVRKEPF